MANTQRTRETEQMWAERPLLDPHNKEDAWYIVCHTSEEGITPEMVEIAEKVAWADN